MDDAENGRNAATRPILIGGGGPKDTVLRGGRLVVQARKPVPDVQALLIEGLPEKAPGTAVFVRDDDGVVALAAQRLWPGAALTAVFMDAWVARAAGANLVANEASDLEIRVLSDLPAGPFDVAAICLPAGEEALRGREDLEEAHDALAPGGRLVAATDGTHHWLAKVVKEVFGNADLARLEKKRGAVVIARRERAAPRRKDHGHEYRFERGGRELVIRTRPGVFSHGRMDPGSKALLQSFRAAPGERVLDLGCGAGVLGLAAAVEAGPERVVLVDANARAVALAEENARRNDLAGVTVVLRADLEDLPGGPFDLVLANPPYFSQGRIAESFAARAAALLEARGRLVLVAKAIDFHRPILQQRFGSVRIDHVDGYGIFTCAKPRPKPTRDAAPTGSDAWG